MQLCEIAQTCCRLLEVGMWQKAKENSEMRRDTLAFVRHISYFLDELSAYYLQHPCCVREIEGRYWIKSS